MKITIVLLALLVVASLSSCKDKKKETEVIVQKVETVEVVEPKPEPVVKPEPELVENYYLVAGCFEIKSNAESLNSKLLSEGYNSKIIPFYNMSMVTYNGFETHQGAQNALNQLVQEAGKELTWIYPVK